MMQKLGNKTFWDSVKFSWDSHFVDALGPRDAIEIKPKSNTVYLYLTVNVFKGVLSSVPTHGFSSNFAY